jgi:hypothetical protein
MAVGSVGCAPFTPTEVSLFPTLIKAGVEGAEPPPGGLWGVSPHETKKGANSPH